MRGQRHCRGSNDERRDGEDSAYSFALDAARQRGNRRAIRQLEAIGPPPHTTRRQFTTRARWVASFGGLVRAVPLTWFESSAHTPHREEPAKFRDLLMTVRATQLAGA